MMDIPITKPQFTDNDLDVVKKTLKSGWVVQGPQVRSFEEKWCAFTNAPYSLATTSCTTALDLALRMLSLEPDDEVIVPSFTWIASANVVEHQPAKVVFCDIDITTFNMDPQSLEACITKKTKAIIPVHLFGLSAKMDDILSISQKHGLYIIEDAACGFGARYKNKHVGTFGKAGCFSFHPRKALTTGEGGMLTLNAEEDFILCGALRDHGAILSDLSRHDMKKPYLLSDFPYAGFNYRMTDIQGALGAVQMDRAEEIVRKRQMLAARYDEELKDVVWLKTPFRHDDYNHGYQSYVCLFCPEEPGLATIDEVEVQRNKFMDYLQTKGIATRPGTHAVHMLDYYKRKFKLDRESCPQSYIAEKSTVTLPLYPTLNDTEFSYIINAIKAYSW